MADQIERDIVEILVRAKIDPTLKTAIDAVASANKTFAAVGRELAAAAKAGAIGTDEMKAAMDRLGASLGKGTGSFREVSKAAAETQKNLSKFGSQGFDATGQAVIRLSSQMQEGMKRIASISATGPASMKGFQDMIRGQVAAAETLPARLKLAQDAMARLEAQNKRGSAEWLVYAANVNRMTDEIRKLDAASKGSVSAMGNIRFAAQNAGFQLQDMAVQFQMGAKASVIFTQQIPQLLGGFALMGGKIGAVAGTLGLAAAAIGLVFGPMIDKLLESLSPMAKFKAATDEMSKATDEFEKKLKQVDFKPFIEQLFSMEKAAAQAFNIFKSFDLASITASAEKAAEAAVGAINSTVAGWNPWRILTNLEGSGQSIDAIKEKFDIARESAEWLARSMAKGPEQLAKDAPFIASTLDMTNAKNRELAKLLETVVNAWARTGQAAKDSAKAQLIATAMATRAAADIKAAYADEAKVTVEKLKLQELEKKGLEANYKEMHRNGDLTSAQLRKLMGTEGEYKKAIKDRIQMMEEWARLLGKTDPSIAFQKSVKEATDLAKALGKSPDELAKVVKYLEEVRDKAIEVQLEANLIKEKAFSWQVSEDTVKSIDRLLAKNKELEEQLKVIALWRYDGQNESADALADKLDLKLLPAAERASSAFRRLKSDVTEVANNQAGFDAWLINQNNIEESVRATNAQIMEVGKSMNALVPVSVQVQAAWEKISDPNVGYAKLNQEIDKFIEKNKLSIEEAKRLKAALNVKDEADQWESLAVSIASNMGNAVNQLIDSFGKTKVSFGEMAAAMLKDIAKLIVQLLIMKPLMDSIKGYFGVSASAQGNAFKGATGLPHGVYTRPTMFPMGGNGIYPFARGGAVGLLAEAGRPEVIAPLKRNRQGDLGVGAVPTIVNIQNNYAQEVEVKTATNQTSDGQAVLDVMVERKVRAMVSNGTLDNQFRSSYGLTRQPA